MPTHDWYHLKRTRVLELLRSRRAGLTQREAAARQKTHGQNSLPLTRPTPAVLIFLRQFHSALIYILLGAALVSLLLRDYVDMYVILGAVLVNVAVGFTQEYRAVRSLERLKSALKLQTLAIRDGEEKFLDTADLVPGDIVLLQTGNEIPADIRLLEVHDLLVNEAKLTGESQPVEKTHLVQAAGLVLADRVNMAYRGTLVISGNGLGVVCETGTTTELGRIVQLMRQTKDAPTPLQERLNDLGTMISLVVLAVSALVLAIGLLFGRNFTDMFSTSVAIAVAAVPEGLAVGVTVILAVGMQRILKHRALVRQLVAAETLGSTTVICADKTGTLTEGRMRVSRIITNNHDLEHASDRFHTHLKEIGDRASFITALKIGVLCNDATIENETQPLEKWKLFGNPTEQALLLAGRQVGLSRERLEKVYPRRGTLPFSSEVKYMMTLHDDPALGRVIFLKGAPELVLKFAGRVDLDGQAVPMTPAVRAQLRRRSEHLSAKGLRTLALAYRPSPELTELNASTRQTADFVFVGLLGLADAIRAEAKETIRQCREAGVRPVLITGDHRLTAQVVARELGLPSAAENILEGSELQALSLTQLTKRVEKISVYARVTPEDKYRIVEAWQNKHQVVAMTGDGVNDAPALRKADIGVALGSGTDVAKETANLVMLDDNFATIVAAIKQGRVIVDNIRKMVLYLLSDSLSAVIIVVGALIMGLPLPLLPVQILWINLITDGFPNIALTQEPPEADIMLRPPQRRRAPIVNFEMRTLILVISAVTGLVTLALFAWYYETTRDLTLARTIAYLSLGLNSLLYVFSCRSLRRSVFRTRLLTNPVLLLAVGLGLIFQIGGIYLPALARVLSTSPLTAAHWGVVITVGVAVVLLIELIKYVFVKTHSHDLE